MSVRLIAVVAALCLFSGCSQKPNEFAELQKSAQAVVDEFAKIDAKHAELLQELKKDPSRLFEESEKAIKSAIAETWGDDSASKATIVVDKSSLKTFGPEKWTVRGRLQADDTRGTQRDQAWEAEIHAVVGEIAVWKVNMNYK